MPCLGEFAIEAAVWPADAGTVRRLFRRYADWLQEDLCYQNFDAELAGLPGFYAPPQGDVLLLRGATGAAVGCIGLRPMGEGACELKRLWVEAEARGGGWGRRLTEAAIARARAAGYRRILLDSLPRLETAVGLYRDLGFVEIAPYDDNPQEGVLYFGLDLQEAQGVSISEARSG